MNKSELKALAIKQLNSKKVQFYKKMLCKLPPNEHEKKACEKAFDKSFIKAFIKNANQNQNQL